MYLLLRLDTPLKKTPSRPPCRAPARGLGVDEDADEEPEAEEDLDEALEEWGAHGGWISKLFLIPFRISRFTLNQSRGFLPTWVLDMVGMIFGKPFKHR